MAAEQNNQFDPDKQKKEQRAERDLKKANIAGVFGSGTGRIAIGTVVVVFVCGLAFGAYNLISGPKRLAPTGDASRAMLSDNGQQGDSMAASPQEAEQRRQQNQREADAARAQGKSYMAPPVLLASSTQATAPSSDFAPAPVTSASATDATQQAAAAGAASNPAGVQQLKPVRAPINYRQIGLAIAASDVYPAILAVNGMKPEGAALSARKATFSTGYYPAALTVADSTNRAGNGGISPSATLNGEPLVPPKGDASAQRKPVPGLTAGVAFYCEIAYGMNSDLSRRDAIAHCYNGAAKDAVFIGKAEPSPEGVADPGFTVTFQKLAMPGRPSLDVNAVGIDNESMEESVADSVNEHTIPKFSMLAVAGALKGLGQAANMLSANSSTQTVGNVSTTVFATQRPNATQIVGSTLGGVGNGIGDFFQKKSDAMKTTIKTYSKKEIGIVLLSDVYE